MPCSVLQAAKMFEKMTKNLKSYASLQSLTNGLNSNKTVSLYHIPLLTLLVSLSLHFNTISYNLGISSSYKICTVIYNETTNEDIKQYFKMSHWTYLKYLWKYIYHNLHKAIKIRTDVRMCMSADEATKSNVTAGL